MKLTHTHLIQAGMPPWDVHKFKLLFPEGADINVENLRLATKHGLDASTLFAAVCPSGVMLQTWYGYEINKDAEKKAVRDRADVECKRLDDEVTRLRHENMCSLLRQALHLEDA